MIIKDFRVYHISKKLNPALPNAVYSLEYIEHVFLELDTDMYTGVGMAYTFNTVQAEAMKLLVEKACVCAVHTGSMGVSARLGRIDTALQHFIYMNKYSKQKKGN